KLSTRHRRRMIPEPPWAKRYIVPICAAGAPLDAVTATPFAFAPHRALKNFPEPAGSDSGVPGWNGLFRRRSGEKTIHRVLRPTEAPPFMRGYSRADLPYEQPSKTDPDGEFGSRWQDDIIINHQRYEPCHHPKERANNDP